MKLIKNIIFILYIVLPYSIFSDSVNTNLTDPKQIIEFEKATSLIRCICLPSLPIKSCSFNNCEISAYLKFFIENRIKQGESAEEIVHKVVNGFGEEALKDPIIIKLSEMGNTGIVNAVVYGFGEKYLAEPDSTPINITLGLIIIAGIGMIYFYAKKVRRKSVPPDVLVEGKADKYLKELD